MKETRAPQAGVSLRSDLRRVAISIFLRETQAKCAKFVEVRSLVTAVDFVRP